MTVKGNEGNVSSLFADIPGKVSAEAIEADFQAMLTGRTTMLPYPLANPEPVAAPTPPPMLPKPTPRERPEEPEPEPATRGRRRPLRNSRRARAKAAAVAAAAAAEPPAWRPLEQPQAPNAARRADADADGSDAADAAGGSDAEEVYVSDSEDEDEEIAEEGQIYDSEASAGLGRPAGEWWNKDSEPPVLPAVPSLISKPSWAPPPPPPEPKVPPPPRPSRLRRPVEADRRPRQQEGGLSDVARDRRLRERAEKMADKQPKGDVKTDKPKEADTRMFMKV